MPVCIYSRMYAWCGFLKLLNQYLGWPRRYGFRHVNSLRNQRAYPCSTLLRTSLILAKLFTVHIFKSHSNLFSKINVKSVVQNIHLTINIELFNLKRLRWFGFKIRVLSRVGIHREGAVQAMRGTILLKINHFNLVNLPEKSRVGT